MERILIRFTKTGPVRFISHLDTMRTLHRAFRRAELPIVYSKGFNPHPSISVAAPLSLGIGSIAEYADVEMEDGVGSSELISRLNPCLPEGMKVIGAIEVEMGMPTSMSAVIGALYSITMDCSVDITQVENIINQIMLLDKIEVMKKTKSGEKLSDIRPLIKTIEVKGADGNRVELECMILSGSRGNLNPELLAEVIKANSMDKINGFPAIARLELYTEKDGRWLELGNYYGMKKS